MTAPAANPAGEAEEKAQERLKALEAALRATSKHPGEVAPIHHLRVSIRRFTQVLRVYADRFEHTRRMRRRLRGLMERCGSVRNYDIAPDVLAAAGASVDAGLNRLLKRKRTRAGKELAGLLKDWSIRSTLRRWRGWLHGESAAGEQAGSKVLAPLSCEFKRAGNAAAKAGAGATQMHRFRLLVKRLRYSLEILGGSRAELGRLRGLQERLGAINDTVTTADLIVELKVPAASRRKIRAALNRLLAKRSAEFRIYWRAHYGPAAIRRRNA
jgi:CHAD domain-containing protein